MCRPTSCKTCGKTTWAGCGMHVAQVRSTVPSGQGCPGHPPSERGPGKKSWVSRLTGR